MSAEQLPSFQKIPQLRGTSQFPELILGYRENVGTLPGGQNAASIQISHE
jgi:hypothetical protein